MFLYPKSDEEWPVEPQNPNFHAPSLKRSQRIRIQVRLSHALLLLIIILAMASCGRQRTRVQPPRQPASTPQQGPGTVGQSAPGGTAGVDGETGRLPETGAGAISLLDTTSAEGPFIRIGLATDASEVIVSAAGEYFFTENSDGTRSTPVHGQIRIRAERGGGADTPETCYRIQVLSLQNREAAEKVRNELEKQFKVPLVLSENSDATSSRIRVGEFRTREEAQTLLDTLKKSGYPDAFIIGDIQFSHNGSATLALRGPDGLFKVSNSGFFFLPASDTEFLSLNGKAYRGFMDIRLNGSGRITAVNRLNIEQYLLGVVPAEMSPYEYPEFHALAAQSIAARTYALKHMGQYESQGFDLTDDTSTQVYGGVALERDASNEAVRRTAGIAVYYDNRLIDAMYMSTCGGRTEDFSEVYAASPVPYLTSCLIRLA
ncbi:MAG: SpoIID/LytB domain-containing protein [Acidobacteriota bacterium]